MKCTICNITVDSLDEAIDRNWIPFFYEGAEQHGPACSDCSRTLLQTKKGGDLEVKEEFRGKIIYHEEEAGGEPEEALVIGLIFN